LHNALSATLLATLVDASGRVAGMSGRLAKRDAIAACLRGASGDEVEIAGRFVGAASESAMP